MSAGTRVLWGQAVFRFYLTVGREAKQKPAPFLFVLGGERGEQ